MKKSLANAIKETTYKTIQEYSVLSGKYVVYIILFLILIINIILSQSIHPLYFQFINGGKSAALEMLKRIKSLPEFPAILSIQEKVFGESLGKSVYKEDEVRKQLILEYEKILLRNPQARDIVYALYFLYKEEGNDAQAKLYLQKAQQLDPTLK